VGSFAALVDADAASMTGADLVDAVVAGEKALSLLAGVQLRMMNALAAPFVAGDPMRLAARLARKSSMTGDDAPGTVQLYVEEAATCLAATEVAASLRISPVTAGIRVREAAVMTGPLKPTLDALEAGVLDRGKARVITEQCRPLQPEEAAAVQDLVLPSAAGLSTSELRDLTAHAVITVDPDGTEERHQEAAARRELTLRPQADAMANLSAYLPADGAVKIFQISDLLATSTAGTLDDPRGIGARRVDALVDIADQLLTHGYLDLTDYIDTVLPDHGTPKTPAPKHDSDDGTTGPQNHADTASASSPRPARDNAGTCPSQPKTTDGTDDSRPGDSTDVATADPEPAGTEKACPETPPATPHHAAQDADPTRRPAGTPTAEPTDADPAAPPNHESSNNPPPNNPPSTSAAAVARQRRSMSRQGRRPHLSVVIGADTLAGLDDRPATLAGFGAIPAGLARSIALSAGTVTALFPESGTGAITRSGALVYRPQQELRDQVGALLSECQFPSCRQPMWRCDLDHRESFDHQHPELGGRTDSANAGPFCRRHHVMKHHTEWRVRVDPGRMVLDWISPTQHRYQKAIRSPLPAAAMKLQVTTGGTALAERLDSITAAAHRKSTPEQSVWGATEEYLTELLLRHQLNQPPHHYDPRPMDRTGTAGHPGTTAAAASELAGGIGDAAEDLADSDPDDDPPPF
jgi:hypothetical protein